MPHDSRSFLTRKILPWLALVGLLGGLLYAFAGLLHADFILFDDTCYALYNEHVQKGLCPEGVLWSLGAFKCGHWQPLTWISMMADVKVYGFNAPGFHATNILLHIANTFLLLLVLYRMTGKYWRSFFVAALFGLHPIHVEAVAWISQRYNLLGTMFWIMAMGAYARAVKQNDRPARIVPVYILFVLGLMTKQLFVVFPCVLLLLDFWPLGRVGTPWKDFCGWCRMLREKVPFFLLSALAVGVGILAQLQSKAVTSPQVLPMSIRLKNAVFSYYEYLVKTIWPFDLAVFYPYGRIVFGQWAVAALFLVAVTALVLVFFKRRPYLFTGWFWYLGILAPMIGILQIGAHAMADRYTYVPLTGIFIMVVWGGADLAARSVVLRRIFAVAGVAALLLLTGMARRQAGYWENSETLFRHAIQVTEDNTRMHYTLATYWVMTGRYQEAYGEYVQAMKVSPHHGEMLDWYKARGDEYAQQGNACGAMACYKALLDINPKYAAAKNILDQIRKQNCQTDIGPAGA